MQGEAKKEKNEYITGGSREQSAKQMPRRNELSVEKDKETKKTEQENTHTR